MAIFDGEGSGYTGKVERVERNSSTITLISREEPGSEPGVEVVLYQGLLHSERMDWLVEKATEAGVSEIVPVLCERSQVKPGSGSWGRLRRWRRLAVAAAKQSGRCRVPRVEEPVPIADLLTARGTERRILFQPGGRPILEMEREPAGGRAMLLVGPEGGWSEGEEESLTGAGWVVVDLGARTLRAETAAVVGVSLTVLLLT